MLNASLRASTVGFGLLSITHLLTFPFNACVEGLALVDSTGQRWGFFPANKSGKGAQSFSSEFEIMRGDLCRVLYDAAVSRGSRYRFALSVKTFTEDNDGLNVQFTDGGLERFDLLVGCDGQGSRVRNLMFGGGSINDDAKYSVLTLFPERIAYFTIPRTIQEEEEYVASAYVMPGKRFLMLRRHREDEMQVYLMAEMSSGSGQLQNMKRGDVKSEKEAFADLFQGGGWRSDEVVQVLKEGADDFYCQYSDFVKMDRWSRRRVTLVGDAGYCCPPNGLGTSMALVGAYVLAGEIGQHCRGEGRAASVAVRSEGAGNEHDDGVLAALEAYEEKFQPYIKEIQKRYSSDPDWIDKIPWTPFVTSLFYYVIWIASVLRLDRIASHLMSSDGMKWWQLPAYEDMVKD